MLTTEERELLNQSLLQGMDSAPGRVRTSKCYPERLLPPHSCALIKYDNNLHRLITLCSRDLRGGCGEKVILDDYRDRQPCTNFKWFFYLSELHPDYPKLTGRQYWRMLGEEGTEIEPAKAVLTINKLTHRNSPTEFAKSDYENWEVLHVADSMEESDSEDTISIEDSWGKFIELAEACKKIIVDLSRLRPYGTDNGKGLMASGPIGKGIEDESQAKSFFSIYEAIANHLIKGDIETLLILLGTINDTLRRGGHKRGIITSSMRWDNPHFKAYMSVPTSIIPGSHKKGVRITHQMFLHDDIVDMVAQAANDEGVFLIKVKNYPPQVGLRSREVETQSGFRKSYTLTNRVPGDKKIFPDGIELTEPLDNVCVTGDTWIQTTDGPRKVAELIGVPFIAVVNGQSYASTEQGFWSNGVRSVVELQTREGYKLKLTNNHKVLVASRKGYRDPYEFTWVAAGELKVGDKIQLSNHRQSPFWEGKGNRPQGWLLGHLVGNGWLAKTPKTKCGETASLAFWGESRQELLNLALGYVNDCLPQKMRRGSDVPYQRPISHKEMTRPDRNVPMVSFSSTALAELAHEYGISQGSKFPTDLVEYASSDFCQGFLQGLFDADAHVAIGGKDGSGKSIQLTQKSEQTTWLVQRLLLRFGIKSIIYAGRNDGIRNFPDGSYLSKSAYRLDITSDNIAQYAALIGFSKPDKRDSLNSLLSSYKKRPYVDKFLATVKSLEIQGEAEVYDCTVNDVHCFDANGIIAHNCVGLKIRHRGTCLIWRVNYGQIPRFEDIPTAYQNAVRNLVNEHLTWRDRVGAKANIYLPVEEDRQVGLCLMGLANALNYWGIGYRELNAAIARFLANESEHKREDELVYYIAKAYQTSAWLADEIMDAVGQPRLERIFTVEPGQNHPYHVQDLQGFTCTRGIWAPYYNRERRVSEHQKNIVVKFGNNNMETARDLGADFHFEFSERWQQLMNVCSGDRAHTISFDTQQPITSDWLRNKFQPSALETKYYSEHHTFDQSYLRKRTVVAVCNSLRADECSVCAE